MLRTEALTRWADSGNKKIIVTYPEALIEKVVTSSVLKEYTISIKVNDKLVTDELMENRSSAQHRAILHLDMTGQQAVIGHHDAIGEGDGAELEGLEQLRSAHGGDFRMIADGRELGGSAAMRNRLAQNRCACMKQGNGLPRFAAAAA